MQRRCVCLQLRDSKWNPCICATCMLSNGFGPHRILIGSHPLNYSKKILQIRAVNLKAYVNDSPCNFNKEAPLKTVWVEKVTLRLTHAFLVEPFLSNLYFFQLNELFLLYVFPFFHFISVPVKQIKSSNYQWRLLVSTNQKKTINLMHIIIVL